MDGVFIVGKVMLGLLLLVSMAPFNCLADATGVTLDSVSVPAGTRFTLGLGLGWISRVVVVPRERVHFFR